MDDVAFNHLVSRVLGRSAPRVWSLLVTMFGDLALSPQARLSGATVNAITAAIGIKPEATRVALHRLRKEDWIESHRTGRQTRYGLTPHGRAQTNAAWPRVYGPAPVDVAAFLVVEDPSVPIERAIEGTGAVTVQIGPRSFVTTARDAGGDTLRLPLDATAPLPRWVTDRLCPPEVQAASVDLAQRLKLLLTEDGLQDLSLLHRTALRVTVVHEWRRLILRTPGFPEPLIADHWSGAECRAAFHDVLTRLPVPDLALLEEDIEEA